MKDIFRTIGFASLVMSMAGCTSDAISIDDMKHEEYVHNFIQTFGVPDPDHNYAMAKSAGLHVTTKKGGHVTVTAEVRGKEYLFADLDVTPGTHALPVTIPASVKVLNIATYNGNYEVNPDATVDIDVPGTRSRYGSYVIDDENRESTMDFVTVSDGDDAPYLVFRPKVTATDFLGIYNKEFAAGKDNTITDVPIIYEGSYQGEPVYYFRDNPHETALSCYGGVYDYYIFPVYWKRNKKGNKDYKVVLHKIYNSEDGDRSISSEFELSFAAPGKEKKGIPFPELGYTTYSGDLYAGIDPQAGTYNKAGTPTRFTYDLIGDVPGVKAGRSDAFPVTGDDNKLPQSVLTRGVKIHLDSPNRDYNPAFSIAVKSNFDADGNYDFVSACPLYNPPMWGENYYDVPLERLYQAGMSTKRVGNLYRTDGTPSIFYVYDPALNLDDFSNNGEWYNKYKNYFHNRSGKFVGLKCGGDPFYLGFSSAPAEAGDGSDREYNEVIFLITRHASAPLATAAYRYTYGTVPPPMTWTIAAEDLGGSVDWDFNDAVFTFTDVIHNLKSINKYRNVAMMHGPSSTGSTMRVITVTPKAAGGIMPIYLTFHGANLHKMPDMLSDGETMYSEASEELAEYLGKNGEEGTFILGCELHKWLGSSDYTKIINTGNSRQAMSPEPVQFIIPTDLDLGDEDTFDYANAVSQKNTPLFGFGVYVDKDNELNIDTFNSEDKGFSKVDLEMGKGSYLIGKPVKDGNDNMTAPQMIMVEGDWEWPAECTNILDAYPNFKDWVESQSNMEWIMNPDPDKVTKK